jgi:hypothetical protein
MAVELTHPGIHIEEFAHAPLERAITSSVAAIGTATRNITPTFTSPRSRSRSPPTRRESVARITAILNPPTDRRVHDLSVAGYATNFAEAVL